ncbi:MAG: hypothetical protein P8M11_01215 [Planctomycetota bacterium]|nr:hypothetical protein [Planctomycetota bacterium]MDG1983164.1 hypothetical protein [Planctomycetota bacterium]
MPLTTHRLLSASLLLLGALSSCASNAQTQSSVSSSEWLQPSGDLQRKINQKEIEVSLCADQVTWIGLSDWFQSVGEPAYPKLIEMVEFGNPRQRSFSLCVIAAMQDRRLLEPMREAMPAASLQAEGIHREYARALAKMGDFSELPVLIEALRDSSPEQFGRAARALETVTNSNIPVSAASTLEEREEIIEAWLLWWENQQQDALLR